MRSIRIINVGVGKNGRPYAKGVCDFEPQELANALQLTRQQSGVEVPTGAFGMINGIADEHLAALVPGDNIEAETVTVSSKIKAYDSKPDAVTGAVERKHGLDFTIRVSGKCSRTAAPTAECDW